MKTKNALTGITLGTVALFSQTVLAASFNETTDFDDAAQRLPYYAGFNNFNLDNGVNTVSGSLNGSCTLDTSFGPDCNPARNHGDTQDSFGITLSGGQSITGISFNISNYVGPTGLTFRLYGTDAVADERALTIKMLNTLTTSGELIGANIPVSSYPVFDLSGAVPSTPLGESIYTFSVFGGTTPTDLALWESEMLGYSFDYTVSYYTISEVPVPAAAWLFGSALLGLAGFKRKA